MDLFLMRVAESEKKSVLYPEDHLRPLTVEGEHITQHIAEELARVLERPFDLLSISNTLRSRETGEILGDLCGYQRQLKVENRLNGEIPPDAIVANLARNSTLKSIMLIADAPIVNDLLAHLITKDKSCRVNIEPGGVALVYTEKIVLGSGILRWLVPANFW